MAQPTPLQGNWSQGMKRDFARNQLPPNSAWNLVDLVLNLGAPLRQRGGWEAGCDCSSIAGSTYLKGGIYSIFSTAAGGAVAKNLALNDFGKLLDVTGAVIDLGAARSIAQNPVFHGGTRRNGTTVYTGLVIIPDGAAVPTTPVIFDGVAVFGMHGSPPAARYAAVYKDYTVLANGVVGTVMYPNRLWWSPTGDPDATGDNPGVTTWNLVEAYNDFSEPIRGLAALKSALLVFHDSHISRIRGSDPPPDDEMTVDDPMFSLGLLDPFSIAEYKDTAIWAAPEGLFRSDGVSLDDLTRKGGMLRYWLDMVPDDVSGYTFAGGVVRDQYVLAVLNGANFVDGFVIDLTSYAWTRISNLFTTGLWSGLKGDSDELYFGRRDAQKVGLISSIFTPGGSNDGDGDVVLPTWESPYYSLGKPGMKRLRRGYLGYGLTDVSAANPTASLSYTLDPFDAAAYTPMTGALTETDGYLRVRRDVNAQAPGVAFKLTRAGRGDLYLYDMSCEVAEQEQSRVKAGVA